MLPASLMCLAFFFFFNDTATTEIYTLSLHDALPIYRRAAAARRGERRAGGRARDKPEHDRRGDGRVPRRPATRARSGLRSEEHTSELQSRQYLVCRLLLGKKKINPERSTHSPLVDRF